MRTTGDRQSPCPTLRPEGVPEVGHQLAVGRDDRGPEIGTGDAPPFGEARARQIRHLAVEQRYGGVDRPNIGSATSPAATAHPQKQRRKPARFADQRVAISQESAAAP